MVNTMENAEEVMQILDRFTRLKQKEIPKELDDYLQYVAKTGDTVFKWSSLKYLFREKLLNVMKNFHDTTPRVDEIPQYPNVDPFNYESMKSSLLERLEHFNAAPFTIQRLCELLIDPRKQYSRIDKFMRALEKNILVVSTVEPGRKRTDSENGDSLDSVVNGDLSLDVNVDIEMDNEALFGIEGQNGNGPVPVAVAAVVEALNDCKEKSTAAIIAAENTNAARSGDDDILPHPKKAKLELHDNEKKREDEPVQKETEKQDLNNGSEETKAEAVVATCLEKTEKVEEKKIEENGNTESEKVIEPAAKQENDVAMADTVEVKIEEKLVEEKALVEEKQKVIEKKEVEEIKIEAEPQKESVSNKMEVTKEEKANVANEKILVDKKEEVDVKKIDDVKEPQEVLKETELQINVAKVENEQVQVETKTEISANIAKVVENIIESVEEKTVESAPEVSTTAATKPQEETTNKTGEKESKDTIVDTEKEIENKTTVASETINSEIAETPIVVEIKQNATEEKLVDQIVEQIAKSPVVEEKLAETEIQAETTLKADKSEETEKVSDEQLTASTENKTETVEDVKISAVAQPVAVTEATVATVAEEQKTEQPVSLDPKTSEEDASPTVVAAKPDLAAEVVQEAVMPATIVAEEVEETMQMPIETDSPTAAGIDIDEMPSGMVSSELVVPTIPILNEASPAERILAPALSLNDQPMEDLPMEESAPEEVIMAESVATGNSGLVEMATDAMEATGKDDGMDVDDTSQEAMDH